jgi:chromosome condensin MukBEF MukE localization factor
MDQGRVIAINKEKIDYDMVEDVLVIFNADKDVFYELKSSVSQRFWKLIDGKRTLKDIFDILYEEYDVQKGKLNADVESFVKKLRGFGVIRFLGSSE